jgi:hypothetical protein
MDGKYKNYKFAWSIMDEQVRCMSFKLYDKAERPRAPEMSLYYSIKGRNNIKKWCVSHVPGNDNHYLWSMNKQDKEENKQGAQGGAAKKGSSEKTAEGVRKKWSEIRGVMGMKKDGDSQENLARFESIVNGQDGFGDSAGDSAGDSECDYEFTDDPVMDYTELLKKLCRECERVHEDADSFDTMLYNYGLEMYGDVPLIEPLETKEEPHFNTLVLAIDTSGSCDGGVAQRFVTETGSIFFDIAHMAEIDHLYLLQCDAEIQSEIRFDGADEVAEYCDYGNVKLKGFGGTDFCPVFERTDELLKAGETVDALIYLTDGCGCYPFEKPDYPVYFVVNVEDMDEDFDEDFDCFGGPEWIKFVKMS